MLTIRPTIRPKRLRADGTTQVFLTIRGHRKQAEHPLGVYVNPAEWDASTGRLKPRSKQAKLINPIIDVKLAAAIQLSCEMEITGGITPSELNARLLGKDKKQSTGTTFAPVLREYCGKARTMGTQGLYAQTFARMLDFSKERGFNADAITFEDMDLAWLESFEAYLSKTHSKNGRNIHLRNIRAVFNYALDHELITCYPFRRFRIRPEATRKRSLTVEKLRELISYPCEAADAPHRDMFLLIFALIGINTADLYSLTKKDIVNGRVEYRRAKTHKLYSIKLEPEAIEILDRYRGQTRLIAPADRYATSHDWGRRINEGLRRIGPFQRVGRGGKKVITPLCPGITTYWARHTWATIAASLDIPKDTIAAALGHGGNTVTDIYIDFDQGKVDAANRRVLDWVLYGGGEPQDGTYTHPGGETPGEAI
ncbi:MAG: recombinase [Barnesiella sp.]|nr:recombinase [Barnesiella sp.]